MVYENYTESVNCGTRQSALALSKHDESVIKYYLPKNEVAADLADFYSIFGDATRVRILSSLCIKEMCVTDICLMLSLPQSTVSHQLKSLKSLRLVKFRKSGKISYYSIANKYVLSVLDTGISFLGY